MDRRTELRRLRRDRELTLAAVALATGINHTWVSLIERGRFLPDAQQAQALAAFFGKPIDALLADAPIDSAQFIESGGELADGFPEAAAVEAGGARQAPNAVNE